MIDNIPGEKWPSCRLQAGDVTNCCSICFLLHNNNREFHQWGDGPTHFGVTPTCVLISLNLFDSTLLTSCLPMNELIFLDIMILIDSLVLHWTKIDSTGRLWTDMLIHSFIHTINISDFFWPCSAYAQSKNTFYRNIIILKVINITFCEPLSRSSQYPFITKNAQSQ